MRVLIFLSGLLAAFALRGQEVPVQNTNAPSVRWNQINTPGFKILFPQGFETQAQRMANTLQYIHDPVGLTMGVSPRKIPILLQNQTSVSNGFVTLAPRRSEFFTMPPQSGNASGTNDWLNLLAVHEYRHVTQFQRSIVGFNKFVYYALGQQALSLLAFVAAPQWFWEGDAVATETAFTPSGRGRIPDFDLVFRTNLQEGRTFNYHKQYLRSYKHNIPDHYVLGYHMITYLRNKTNDPLIWEKVARRSWSVPFIPFGFSRAIRKEAGMSVTTLFNEMADDRRTAWEKNVAAITKTKFQTLVDRSSSTYIDYMYPQVLDDGSIVAMKSGIGDIPQLVTLKEGKEVKRFVIGPYNDPGMLSVSGQTVVWNEFRYDPRWRMKTYSIVRSYDFSTGTRLAVTSHSRYAGPSISPDGTKVAVVESATDYTSTLVILNYPDGAELSRFKSTDGQLITMPRWAPDGQSIVALKLTAAGKSVVRFQVSDQSVTELIPASRENIAHPVLTDKYLFYNSPFSGIDNIYVLELSSGKKFQVTSSQYGSYNPAISPDGEWIYYNEQTRDGMDVVRTALEPTFWTPLDQVIKTQNDFPDQLVDQEGHPDILKEVPNNIYQVKPYKKINHLINAHSWGPFFNTTVTQADLGISSRNLLGTTTINAGYQFDINERTGYYHAGLSYQGIYPIFDLDATHGSRQLTTGLFDRDVKFTWKETGVKGAVRIPLILTASKFHTTLDLKNAVGLTHVWDFRNQVSKDGVLISSGTGRKVAGSVDLSYIFPDQVSNGDLLYNMSAISFSHYLRMSRRDINPRWGFLVDVENYSTPYGGDFKGSLFATRTLYYLPGLARHHSLMLRADFQNGSGGYEADRYRFRNSVFRPRGFRYNADRQFTSLSVNYMFPLWYPDIALGPLLNIQRIRPNFFFDHGIAAGRNYFYQTDGQIRYSDAGKTYQSVGVEVKFDVNIMRLLPQLDLGFRFTRGLSQKEDLTVEFLLGGLNL